MRRTTLMILLLSCIFTRVDAQERGLGDDAPEVANQRYGIGVQLYLEGKYAEAAREFRVAQKLVPNSPKLAYNIARCDERAGELPAALESYELYLRLAPTAEDRAEVEAVIAGIRAELDARKGKVVITSEPPGASVFLDGDLETASGQTPLTVRLDAGSHAVRLVLDGFRPHDQVVDLAEKATIPMSVTLMPVGGAAAPTASVAEEKPAPAPDSDWKPIAGWSLVGAGVAGLVVGAVFHAQASSTHDEGSALGPGRDDERAALQSDLDSQQTLMWTGYGLGAALGAAGAALLLWPDDDASVALAPGPGGLAAWGRW